MIKNAGVYPLEYRLVFEDHFDTVSLTITFNKNMNVSDAQNTITREFTSYDNKNTRITNVNNKIDSVLAGL